MTREEIRERIGELQEVGLSPREAQVWARLERGWSHEEIASSLEIEKSTSRTYAERVREELEEARDLIRLLELERATESTLFGELIESDESEE